MKYGVNTDHMAHCNDFNKTCVATDSLFLLMNARLAIITSLCNPVKRNGVLVFSVFKMHQMKTVR